MPRTLIRKNPSNFKTLPLFVEATPKVWPTRASACR